MVEKIIEKTKVQPQAQMKTQMQMQSAQQVRTISQIPQGKLRDMVRIFNTDIEGHNNIYSGLTQIKGISWALSNAICKISQINRYRKVGSLSDEEVKKVERNILETSKNPSLPKFMLNLPKNEEKPRHLLTIDLELYQKMRVKQLREIQSYRGIRHVLGLPVRGQRTKAHFRKGRSVGVVKKKVVPSKKPSEQKGKK